MELVEGDEIRSVQAACNVVVVEDGNRVEHHGRSKIELEVLIVPKRGLCHRRSRCRIIPDPVDGILKILELVPAIRRCA